jgi:hypothetical protein
MMYSKKVMISCAIISMIFINACDFAKLKDAVDDFKVVVELEPVNTYGVIQILDANTEELVTGQVKVTFLDENGDPDEHTIIDSYSTAMSKVTVRNGFVNFGIRNEIVPTEENPAIITVLIEREGYEDHYTVFTITETGSNLFEVKIVDKSNLPEGIVMKEVPAGNTSTSGVLESDVEILSGADDNSNMRSDINFSSGIRLLGSDGSPITGQLKAGIRSYDTSKSNVADIYSNLVNPGEEDMTEKLILGVTEIVIANQAGEMVTRFEPAVQKDGTLEFPVLNFSFNKDLLPNNIQLQDMRLKYQLIEDSRIYYYDYNENTWALQTVENKNGTDFLKFTINLQNFESFPATFWIHTRAMNPITGEIRIFNPAREPERVFIRNLSTAAGASSTTGILLMESNLNRISFPITAFQMRIFWVRECNRLPDSVSLICNFRIRDRILQFVPIQLYPTLMNIHIQIVDTGERLITQHNFLTDGNVVNISLPGGNNILRNTAINIDLRCPNPSQKVRVTSIPAATVMYRKVGSTRWLRAGNIQWDYQNLALNGAKVKFPSVEAGAEYEFRLLYDTQSVQPSETAVFNDENEVLNRVLTLSSSQASNVCD